MRQIFRLIIFAIVMLLGAAAMAQDIKVPFATGAPAPNKYAYTPQGLWTDSTVKFTKYAKADTALLFVGMDGKLISIDASTFIPVVDSSLFVTVTRLRDSLALYQKSLGFTPQRILSIVDKGAQRPYDSTYCNRSALQAAINELAGVVETSYDSLNQSVTYVRVRDSFLGGIVYVPDSIYFIKNSLIKFINGDTFNAQIYIPNISFDSARRQYQQVTIEIRGAYPPDVIEGSIANVQAEKWINGGSRLQSTLPYDGSDWPAMIANERGTETVIGDVTIYASAIMLISRNMWYRSAYDAAAGGMQIGNIDYDNAHNMQHIDCRTDANTSGSGQSPTTNKVFNIRLNSTYTGTCGVVERGMSGHGRIGVVMGAHNILDNHMIVYTKYAIEPTICKHPMQFRKTLLQWNQHQMHTGSFGGRSNTGGVINAGANMSGDIIIESPSTGNFVRTSPDFMDSTNIMSGEITMWAYSNSSGFGTTGPIPTRYRATKLNVKVAAVLSANGRRNTGISHYGADSLRFGEHWRNSTTVGQTNLILDNDRGASEATGSFIQVLTTGSANTANRAGFPAADRQAVVSGGASSTGMIVGTTTSDSLFFATNDVLRGGFMPAGTFFTVGDAQIGGSNLTFLTTGAKLKFNVGTNGTFGTATLSSGTVTVNTTAVTALSRIILTKQSCSNCGDLHISAKVNGTSFTITSANGSDASTVAWLIMDSNN